MNQKGLGLWMSIFAEIKVGEHVDIPIENSLEASRRIKTVRISSYKYTWRYNSLINIEVSLIQNNGGYNTGIRISRLPDKLIEMEIPEEALSVVKDEVDFVLETNNDNVKHAFAKMIYGRNTDIHG